MGQNGSKPAKGAMRTIQEAQLAMADVRRLEGRLADAEALKQISEQQGLTLMVGHILLYHPAIIKLKEIE